jgi:hypothetical protein
VILSRVLLPFLVVARWLRVLLSLLFGTIHWQPPRWWQWTSGHVGRFVAYTSGNRAAALTMVLAVVTAGAGAWYGWQWYRSLPEPHTVSYQVDAPGLTDYEQTPVVIQPLRVRFDAGVAPLAGIGKPVTDGIELRPATAGTWTWTDDRTLEFVPDGDWPIDGDWTLRFARHGLLADGSVLDDHDAEFSAPEFSAQITSVEFYQDPEDATVKRLVAAVNFSHPVDVERLRDSIDIRLGPGLQFRDAQADNWTVTPDKLRLNAGIYSAPLGMPAEAVTVTLVLNAGLRAARGGNETAEALEQEITVPGRFQLTFGEIAMSHVENARGEPEQVLMFDSEFPVADEALRDHVRAWLLPESEEHWHEGNISEDVLRQSAELSLEQIPGASTLNSHHAFRFRAPVRRTVYVLIAPQVEAIGGYRSKQAQAAAIVVDDYPQSLKVVGDGALLSLGGERKVGFMAQGLPGVKVEIARLLPQQLHHLVDMNGGRFAQPDLYGAAIDRLVERMVFTREYAGADPGKPHYDHVDLAPYLDAADGRRGVFLLRLMPFDPADPDAAYSEYDDSNPATDRRLVLVTDLGIISKRTQDGTLEVYVQSISDGTPVAGAGVELLGRNGLPVLEATTDRDGHASLPQAGELKRERSPILVVARRGNDLSFLPLVHYEHRLDFSRFEIGGRHDISSPDQLTAWLFSDRGLYRPGETAHLGYIVRSAAFRSAPEGLPVELEITDPRGAVVYNERRAWPAGGMDAVDFATDANAPAGSYYASVYLVKERRRDDQIGTTSFKVRDFEPDRLKVDLTLADGTARGWLTPDALTATLQARHLFGAPASDRRVTAELRLSPAFPEFPQYADYRFHVEDVIKDAVSEDLPETRTDANGAAQLELGLGRFARNTYRMHVIARVFEAQGGRNVAAEQARLVSGAPFLVGVRATDPLDYVSKDALRRVQLLAIGPDLKPLAADGLSLAHVEYRYVSVLVKQNSGVYKYESQRREVVRDSRPLSLAAGNNELPLPTGEPGEFAFIVRDAGGNELNKVSWTVAGTANLTRSLERNAELQMKLDKTAYAPGESIAISIRAPYTGSGLITIEREKVYAQRWFRTDTTSSVQSIEVPADLEGNAYVNVQFVRDAASSEIYMSPLSYAVAPFAVSLEARTLDIEVATPALIEPGGLLTMQVKAGVPARAVVFAVDEGILQVARYRRPDPLGYFFQKRSLQVDTAQILNLILPEFQRLLEAAAPGGDADAALGRHLNPFKRKRQGPVAWWSGLIDLPAGGSTLEYRVPDSFNGRLRVMAVALTDERIGVFEGGAEVRGPWVLTPNVPAFVAPGDEFEVSVGVFSNLEQGAEVTLKLDSGAGLQAVGARSATFTVEPGREGISTFRLRAADVLGSSELRFEAVGGSARASIRESVSVRPAVPYRVELQAGRFTSDSHRVAPRRSLHDELRKVELGLARSPLVWAQGLQRYLDDYPYSCTEQLVSRAMPALVWSVPDDGDDEDLKAVRAAFSILRQRQNSDGGFGLWAANPIVEPQVSVYAADFLVEAKERGIVVPPDLLNRTRRWLQRVADQPANNLTELRTRAQAAYLLTRLGTVTTGSIAGTLEQLDTHYAKTWRNDIIAAYVAATRKLLKQDREAGRIIRDVPWHLDDDGARAGAMDFGSYYDPMTHDAQLLALTVRHFPERLDDVPVELLDALGRRLTDNDYNSLSAALTVRALDLFGRGADAQGGTLEAVAEMPDHSRAPLAFDGHPPRASLPQGFVAVHLQRRDSGLPSFYLVAEGGFDRAAPQQTLVQGIEVTRDFLDADGQPLGQVRVGDEFLVRLRMRASGESPVAQAAIVDLLPGGVEPVTQAAEPIDDAQAESSDNGDGEDQHEAAWQSPIGEAGQGDWDPYYADVRDDRVVLYGTLQRDTGTLVYRVRAVNAGTFAVPPPYAEDMYNRALQGRGAAGTLTIVKP